MENAIKWSAVRPRLRFLRCQGKVPRYVKILSANVDEIHHLLVAFAVSFHYVFIFSQRISRKNLLYPLMALSKTAQHFIVVVFPGTPGTNFCPGPSSS